MLDFSPSRLLHGQDSEKQLQPNPEPVDTLLADDNRIRKRLPEERGSLLKAISDTLYFTTIYHEEIQEYLIKHLKTLIATNKLPSRLSMFQGNSILLKDFTMSPHLPGFEKINLELVSSAFNVRVTVYGMTEDDYLSSLIINSKHTKQIEFLRTKNNHYDPVYSTDYMEKAGICQNIVLNIIDQALGINSTSFKDKNKDNYINFEYKNWLISKQNQNGLDQFRITRGRHKKSLSDPYAKNKDSSDDQMKIYNIFTNMKPPEDFLSKINMRKDTVESNFSINADLDFVNEQEPPPPTNPDFAIKNYPIPSPGYSFTQSHPHEIRPSSPQPQRTRQIHQDDIFFHENLSLAEIERLERTPSNNASTTVSSAYYINSEPPTFTPTRYMPKGYSYTEVPHNPNGGLDNSSPTFKPKESMKTMGIKNYTHSLGDTPPQNAYGMNGMNGMGYQQMHPQAQGYGHPFMPRGDNMQMQMQVNPYNMNPQAMQPYSQPPLQGNFGGNAHMGNIPPTTGGKKKQAILEDGSRRYSGRLKFFDEMKNYGFIIMDEDGSDLFVHYDDLAKANLSKDLLKTAKAGNVIKLTFSCMQYVGKYNKSRKAVDIQVVM